MGKQTDFTLAEASFEEILAELASRYTAVVIGISGVMANSNDNREMVTTTHRGNHSHCLGLWAAGHTRSLSSYHEINEVRILREEAEAAKRAEEEGEG